LRWSSVVAGSSSFPENAADVLLDRTLADPKLMADGAVAASLGDRR